MESQMRKVQIEKKIMQELSEIRKLESRASKVNEDVLVKRISESYRNAGLSIDFREFKGPYTFKDFEKYLYEQLSLLRANRRRSSICNSESSDDIEKLADALKKMNSTKLPFMFEELNNPKVQKQKSRQRSMGDLYQSNDICDNNCHHTTNSYSGVPCSAYFGNGRRGTVPYTQKIKLGLNMELGAPTNISNDPFIRRLIEAENSDNKPFEVEELLKDQKVLKGLCQISQSTSMTSGFERRRSLTKTK